MGGNFTQIYIVDCKLQRRRPNHGSCLDADEFVQTGSQEKKSPKCKTNKTCKCGRKIFPRTWIKAWRSFTKHGLTSLLHSLLLFSLFLLNQSFSLSGALSPPPSGAITPCKTLCSRLSARLIDNRPKSQQVKVISNCLWCRSPDLNNILITVVVLQLQSSDTIYNYTGPFERRPKWQNWTIRCKKMDDDVFQIWIVYRDRRLSKKLM